jgi:hypothetical protein
MKSGYMYMTPYGSEFFALVPTRCWYAPWLWNVEGIPTEAPPQQLLSKVRRSDAYGLMKILGATNLEN